MYSMILSSPVHYVLHDTVFPCTLHTLRYSQVLYTTYSKICTVHYVLYVHLVVFPVHMVGSLAGGGAARLWPLQSQTESHATRLTGTE